MLMSYLIEKKLSLGMLGRHKAYLLLVSAELNILDLSKEAVNISQPRCIGMHLRFLLFRESFPLFALTYTMSHTFQCADSCV